MWAEGTLTKPKRKSFNYRGRLQAATWCSLAVSYWPAYFSRFFIEFSHFSRFSRFYQAWRCQIWKSWSPARKIPQTLVLYCISYQREKLGNITSQPGGAHDSRRTSFSVLVSVPSPHISFPTFYMSFPTFPSFPTFEALGAADFVNSDGQLQAARLYGSLIIPAISIFSHFLYKFLPEGEAREHHVAAWRCPW